MYINNKHKRTLKAIFENPVRANIPWIDLEALFGALGCQITFGDGSRLRVYLNGIRAVFHRPHHKKEVPKFMIADIRRFLVEAKAWEIANNPGCPDESDEPDNG